MESPHHTVSRSLLPGAIVAGLILLVLGAGMLLDTTGLTDIRIGRLIAPLVLMSIGVSSLLNDGISGRCRGGSRPAPTGNGLWMLGLGAWMMASQTQVFGLTFGNSWPVVVILTGLMVVIRGMR